MIKFDTIYRVKFKIEDVIRNQLEMALLWVSRLCYVSQTRPITCVWHGTVSHPKEALGRGTYADAANQQMWREFPSCSIKLSIHNSQNFNSWINHVINGPIIYFATESVASHYLGCFKWETLKLPAHKYSTQLKRPHNKRCRQLNFIRLHGLP